MSHIEIAKESAGFTLQKTKDARTSGVLQLKITTFARSRSSGFNVMVVMSGLGAGQKRLGEAARFVSLKAFTTSANEIID